MATTNNLQPPSSTPKPHPIFIAGPTAVGKSAVALVLAEEIKGEIISVDSMQVYRGMDIGTAKPPAAERTRVRHHLLDVVEVTEDFDAAKFVRLANAAVQAIQARGHTPILCGGTGLYFKAFLEGLGDAPPANESVRAKLQATPIEVLLRELQARDPLTFERIDRKNPRRVIRAIEVIRLTGRPFSEHRADWTPAVMRNPASDQIFCLRRSNADLRARIDRRVDQMFADGLVQEVRSLLRRGLAQNRTALQALGYRQAADHLAGKCTLEEVIELVKLRTRQFAKRQMTWFRKQANVIWLDINELQTPEVLADLIRMACLKREKR